MKVPGQEQWDKIAEKNSEMFKKQIKRVLGRENHELKSKIDYKNHIKDKLDQWSFFDSNINNNLVE